MHILSESFILEIIILPRTGDILRTQELFLIIIFFLLLDLPHVNIIILIPEGRSPASPLRVLLNQLLVLLLALRLQRALSEPLKAQLHSNLIGEGKAPGPDALAADALVDPEHSQFVQEAAEASLLFDQVAVDQTSFRVEHGQIIREIRGLVDGQLRACLLQFDAVALDNVRHEVAVFLVDVLLVVDLPEGHLRFVGAVHRLTHVHLEHLSEVVAIEDLVDVRRWLDILNQISFALGRRVQLLVSHHEELGYGLLELLELLALQFGQVLSFSVEN